ncbi:DNA repair protein XRCC4-like [Dioscorea cayenensis subsp. rotundata]|uniref:DNA repair protein XRCC4-like n=1 Tax=Dioscorea cayennensis subsp. rotundata TaxID=55577 RepID=A0AB40D1T6_DIOCR|nr:DNA repair protein XRCC4-like [Dioscorea cayenensis subsp. rotundata]
MESDRHTCLKLELPSGHGPIFVKGTWFNSHFHLFITDGLHAWTCHATEAEVRLRAEQWDQPVSDYLALVERYLGLQQPGSCYAFEDAGNGSRRLSWTFEKQGTKLEWRWKCQPSSDDKQTTAQILDFLMDANIHLSDEVVRNSQAFAKLKSEAERCLSLSEKYNKEKDAYETAVYGKFVAVLNSKKAKLRALRDKISKLEGSMKAPAEDNESTDKTESFDEESSDDQIKEEPAEKSYDDVLIISKKNVATSTQNVRKRKTRK